MELEERIEKLESTLELLLKKYVRVESAIFGEKCAYLEGSSRKVEVISKAKSAMVLEDLNTGRVANVHYKNPSYRKISDKKEGDVFDMAYENPSESSLSWGVPVLFEYVKITKINRDKNRLYFQNHGESHGIALFAVLDLDPDTRAGDTASFRALPAYSQNTRFNNGGDKS